MIRKFIILLQLYLISKEMKKPYQKLSITPLHMEHEGTLLVSSGQITTTQIDDVDVSAEDFTIDSKNKSFDINM